MKCDELKHELTAYEAMEGAYGMYLAVDGVGVDVDFGSLFYPKVQVDERIKAMEKHIAELKAELSDARDDARSSRKLIDDKNEEINELTDKIQQKDFFWDGCGFSKMGFKNANDVANYVDSLKAVDDRHYVEWKEAKRALWMARAKRAIEKIAWFKLWNASISTMNPEDGARQEYDKWKKALGKCLHKAEEYK